MLRKLINFLLKILGTPGEHHLMRARPKTKKVPFERRFKEKRKK